MSTRDTALSSVARRADFFPAETEVLVLEVDFPGALSADLAPFDFSPAFVFVVLIGNENSRESARLYCPPQWVASPIDDIF